MSKTIIIGGVLLLIAIAGFIFITKDQSFSTNEDIVSNDFQQHIASPESTSASSPTQAADYQASFAIFTNGTFRVFSASMYHNLSPDVYIEASNPNVIKVKQSAITWYDFFSTLPFKLTHECLTTGTKETFCTDKNGTLKFYLNGELRSQILDQEIQDGDKLLVTYGNEPNEVIQDQLNKIPNTN